MCVWKELCNVFSSLVCSKAAVMGRGLGAEGNGDPGRERGDHGAVREGTRGGDRDPEAARDGTVD